jgi:hypothetical protein
MARKWFDYDGRQQFSSQGVNDAWWLKHRSVGRENSFMSPYLLANEWICGNIAQCLRLPIPPFALMRSGPTAKGMFASLKYGSKKVTPDDANPDRCFRNLPRLCTGILLFDIFVANSDRHSGNIKVDVPFDPKVIDIFDHDRALFGALENDGVKRLQDLLDRLGVGKGSVSGGNRHCFIDVVDTTDHFHEWLERISLIPDYFIDDICADAKGIPVGKDEIEMATTFLKYRKKKLSEIIANNKAEFTKISTWGML